MANIDNELLEICGGSEGKAIRKSIVKALQRINEDRTNAENKVLTITREDNHKTITGGPWDKIVVAVSDEGVNNESACSVLDDIEVDANGYYDLWTTNWPEGHGWKGITVNVPDADYFGGERTITKNGEYFPEFDGFDGYSKVYVNVKGGGQEGQSFKVKFYNQWDTVIQEQNVNFGEDAVFQGELPKSDTPFMRWDPEPVKVSYNMDCHPVFYDAGYRGTIPDDWRTIQRDLRSGLAGKKYKIGDTKVIPCSGFQSEVEMVLIDLTTSMIVAEDNHYSFRRPRTSIYGSDGYVSLWISKDALYGTRIAPEQVINLEQEDIEESVWNPREVNPFVYLCYKQELGPCSYAALQLYWWQIGISWKRDQHSGDDSQPTPQSVFNTAYKRYANGGVIELEQRYYDTLLELGIHNNVYRTPSGANDVGITLESPALHVNVPQISIVWDSDNEVYIGKKVADAPSYGQYYSGNRPTNVTMKSLNEYNAGYSGNQLCPYPLTSDVGYIPFAGHNYGIDYGYTREFLVL